MRSSTRLHFLEGRLAGTTCEFLQSFLKHAGDEGFI